jgi:hypothetical protein
MLTGQESFYTNSSMNKCTLIILVTESSTTTAVRTNEMWYVQSRIMYFEINVIKNGAHLPIHVEVRQLQKLISKRNEPG